MPAQWQLGQLVLSVSTLRAKVLSLQLLLNMAGILPTKGGQSVYFEVVLLLGFLDELVILVGTLEVAHHFLKQLLHWALNYLIYHNKRHKQSPQTIQFKKQEIYIDWLLASRPYSNKEHIHYYLFKFDQVSRMIYFGADSQAMNRIGSVGQRPTI